MTGFWVGCTVGLLVTGAPVGNSVGTELGTQSYGRLEGFGVGCLVGLSVTGAKVGGADGFEVEPVVVSSVIIGKETKINVGAFVIFSDLSDSGIVGWAVGSLETGEVVGK